MAEALIIRRLEATLARMSDEGAEPCSIELCASDRAALDQARSANWNEGYPRKERMKLHVCAFLGHPVRQSKLSMIYSKDGVGFTVRRGI